MRNRSSSQTTQHQGATISINSYIHRFLEQNVPGMEMVDPQVHVDTHGESTSKVFDAWYKNLIKKTIGHGITVETDVPVYITRFADNIAVARIYFNDQQQNIYVGKVYIRKSLPSDINAYAQKFISGLFGEVGICQVSTSDFQKNQDAMIKVLNNQYDITNKINIAGLKVDHWKIEDYSASDIYRSAAAFFATGSMSFYITAEGTFGVETTTRNK